MVIIRHFYIVLAAILTAGCTTTLSSHKVKAVDAAESLPSGILYYLPATTLDVSVQFLAINCVGVPGAFHFEYEILNADIKSRLVPDPAEAHVLSYAELNSALKTTTANVSLYPNGMLKSLNAEIDDRTAQVISSISGSVVNLAKAAAFGPAGIFSFDAEEPPPTPPCGNVVTAKLKSYDILKSQLIEAQALDADLTKRQETLTDAKKTLAEAQQALAAAAKDLPAAEKEKLQNAVEAAQQALKVATGLVGKDKPLVPGIQAKLAKLVKRIGTTATVSSWIPTAANACLNLTADPKQLLGEMFNDEGLTKNDKTEYDKILNTLSKAPIGAQVCLTAAAGARPVQQSSVPEAAGLIYRMPVSANLEIKKLLADSSPDSKAALPSTSMLVPQWGLKAALPLKNENFDKNSLKVAFQEDGSLVSVDFTTVSRAERAGAALQDLSKAYVDFLDQRQQAQLKLEQATDDATKRAQARELNSLDAKIADIKKRREVEEARSGIADRLTMQTSAVSKEKALIDAQIELEKSRQALEVLRAK